MNEKKKFWHGVLVGGLGITFLVGIIGIGLIVFLSDSGLHLASGSDEGVIWQSTESKIEFLDSLIQKEYLYSDDMEGTKMQEELIRAYIDGLGDPYSVYYNEEETKELWESTKGEFSGIGVVISQDVTTGLVTFNSVYENSPAKEAGFQAGDILYKVNGTEITGRDLNDVVKEIKGEEGTTVEITVLRGEELAEVTATATRRKIEVVTVTSRMLEDNIGYVAVSEFDDVTYEQFKTALDTLEKQGMEGLIVDLRNNPGGSLSTVCDMLDLLLPKGTLVYTEDKNGKRETYTSDPLNKMDLSMAVLVNGNSASASEIFAGAMQDYDAAEIVGTTTYGKGIVQQLFPLTDGTCVKLTISEYFTPNGRNIHGSGIEPDVKVEYQYSQSDPSGDNQLDAAIASVRKNLK